VSPQDKSALECKKHNFYKTNPLSGGVSRKNKTLSTAPITVGIPTFGRGIRVLQVLEKLEACEPKPFEIFVYIDDADKKLAQFIQDNNPRVKILTGATRVGPGGARHRCLNAASQPFFASFDDDSWPIDSDYFSVCIKIMNQENKVAVLEASIFHQNQKEPTRKDALYETNGFTGCGHVMRVSAYRQVSGYVDRPWAYGLEERDVSMQLMASNWKIIKTSMARVFHDTGLKHHGNKEITKATIENAALLPWLRYPFYLWPIGVIQYMSVIRSLIKKKRWPGIADGLLGSFHEIWKHRKKRAPLPGAALVSILAKKSLNLKKTSF